jgi:hypothetical protein
MLRLQWLKIFQVSLVVLGMKRMPLKTDRSNMEPASLEDVTVAVVALQEGDNGERGFGRSPTNSSGKWTHPRTFESSL